MWYVVQDDELYHHGIKGQRWGVRRFQNPDGTLTSAGKKRYAMADVVTIHPNGQITSSKRDAKRAAAKARREAKRQEKSDVKNRRTLSDKELQQKIQRLQMEKQLKDLTRNDLHHGRSEADSILKQIGTKTIATVATGALLYGAKHLVENKGKINKEYAATVDYQQLANAVFNGGPKKNK